MTEGCHVNRLQRNIVCIKGLDPICSWSPFQPSVEPCTPPDGMQALNSIIACLLETLLMTLEL